MIFYLNKVSFMILHPITTSYPMHFTSIKHNMSTLYTTLQSNYAKYKLQSLTLHLLHQFPCSFQKQDIHIWYDHSKGEIGKLGNCNIFHWLC